MARIDRIYRYPVKGLSAEPLTAVALTAGEGLPLDRKFALARPETAFDPARPAWLPKRHFLMLMRDERLAELDVAYDDASGRLRIARGGRPVVDADTGASAGRETIERFFEAFMADRVPGRPRLVSAPGHMFTDSATPYVSLINLATVRAIEEAIEQEGKPSTRRSIRCAFAPISTSTASIPASSSSGWVASWRWATCACDAPSGSTVAPPPTSIPRPPGAT